MLLTHLNSQKKLNLLVVILAILMLGYIVKFRFLGLDGQAYTHVIEGDAKGYYAYLPAVFIYNDLTFSFFDKDPEKFGFSYAHTFLLNHEGKNFNKYTCGEAILLLPFFLLAMLYSWIFQLPVDGYNHAFQVFCVVGSWFYFIIGLYFSKKFLQLFDLSAWAIALGLIGITLGSNLLHYVAHESCMSHVFSFALVAVHVWLVKKYFAGPSLKKAIFIGLTLGLIFLIRPVNIIVVFSYPFLAGGLSFFFTDVKDHFKHFLLLGLSALLVIFIQLILWKLQTGAFILYAYKNEGFYFLHPHFFEYILGFKKGAFIYSPILFFAFLGLYVMWKNRHETFLLGLFLLLVFYVHASWWSWYYGDGMGERPLIDFYVFFILLIAFAFHAIKKTVWRMVLPAFFVMAVLLFQVFFYQYYKSIIHPYSMNFKKFCHVFLKTSNAYRNLFRSDSEDFYHPNGVTVVDSVSASLTDTNALVPAKLAFNKKNIRQNEYYDAGDMYPFTYQVTTNSSWLFKARYAEIDLDYMQPEADSAAYHMNSYITMDFADKSPSYFSASTLADKAFNEAGEWQHAFERKEIGISENTGDVIKIFIDNPKGKKLFIKNLRIKIVEATP
jgi:hypothetical protein